MRRKRDTQHTLQRERTQFYLNSHENTIHHSNRALKQCWSNEYFRKCFSKIVVFGPSSVFNLFVFDLTMKYNSSAKNEYLVVKSFLLDKNVWLSFAVWLSSCEMQTIANTTILGSKLDSHFSSVTLKMFSKFFANINLSWNDL